MSRIFRWWSQRECRLIGYFALGLSGICILIAVLFLFPSSPTINMLGETYYSFPFLEQSRSLLIFAIICLIVGFAFLNQSAKMELPPPPPPSR